MLEYTYETHNGVKGPLKGPATLAEARTALEAQFGPGSIKTLTAVAPIQALEDVPDLIAASWAEAFGKIETPVKASNESR